MGTGQGSCLLGRVGLVRVHFYCYSTLGSLNRSSSLSISSNSLHDQESLPLAIIVGNKLKHCLYPSMGTNSIVKVFQTRDERVADKNEKKEKSLPFQSESSRIRRLPTEIPLIFPL